MVTIHKSCQAQYIRKLSRQNLVYKKNEICIEIKTIKSLSKFEVKSSEINVL
jgi:hypothetical protein